MTRYVIDIPSNRVIFFTEDSGINLVLTESTVIYEDVDSPPETMTLSNAWNWKLVGRTFVPQTNDTVIKLTPSEQAFKDNKDAVLKFLKDQINKRRNEVSSDYVNGQYVVNFLYSLSAQSKELADLARAKNISIDEMRQEIFSKLESFNSTMIRTEIWKEHYLKRINDCTSNNDLSAIRDEIGSVDFGRDLY